MKDHLDPHVIKYSSLPPKSTHIWVITLTANDDDDNDNDQDDVGCRCTACGLTLYPLSFHKNNSGIWVLS